MGQLEYLVNVLNVFSSRKRLNANNMDVHDCRI